MKTTTLHQHTNAICKYASVYAATVGVLADIFLETSGEVARFSRSMANGLQ